MATYTAITDAEIDQDSPITQTLMTKYRDNLTAVIEGDASAPKVRTAALQAPAAGTSYLIMRLQEAEVGTGATLTSYPTVGLHNRYSANQHLGVTCLVAGTITAYLQHRGITFATSYVRVLKNGSVVTEWSTSSSTYQTRSVNISVAVGDTIIFQNRNASGSENTDSQWRYLRIYSNNPDFAVA